LTVVSRIPKGSVMTYGAVARAAGKPNAARAVGAMMHINVNPRVPCHRVVGSHGWIGGFRGGVQKKIRMLRKESVDIRKFHATLQSSYGHKRKKKTNHL
jgi:O-6-methylguanine DNA methyltransferase